VTQLPMRSRIGAAPRRQTRSYSPTGFNPFQDIPLQPVSRPQARSDMPEIPGFPGAFPFRSIVSAGTRHSVSQSNGVTAMRSRYILAAAASMLVSGFALADPLHLVGQEAWLAKPTGPATVYSRIEQAAATYATRGQIQRIALFDIAYPADSSELESLGGYGVVLVAALSHSKEELPPRRVYVRVATTALDLVLLSSVCSMTPPASQVASVLGNYLCESIYLFPVFARFADADLMLDFAENRDGFVLGHFSANDSSPLNTLPLAVPTIRRPPEKNILAFVSREYPDFVVEGAVPAR